MPPLKRSDLVRALKRKFDFDPKGGRKHDRFQLERGGKKLAWTMVSRGKNYEELASPLVSKISRQLQVDAKTLVGMVDCTVSQDQYLELLSEAESP